MPSCVALKSSELLKLGFSVTESPLASSTGVPLAKDALAWQPSQPSQQSSQQQSQSQSQSSQQQLLQQQLLQESQPQPQPVLRAVPQLLHVLQPQPLRAVPQPLQPHLLQPQLLQLLQGSQHSQQELTGPQGPVKKGKFRFAQLPQRLNGPEMLRSTPKQLQPVRAVPQPQPLQVLQPQPVLRALAQLLHPQPVRAVAQVLQPHPQPVRAVAQVLQPHPQPVLRTLAQPQPEAQDRIFATGIVSFL